MARGQGPGRAALSRRGLLKGAGATAFGLGSLAALNLPFFDVSGAQQDPAQCRPSGSLSSRHELLPAWACDAPEHATMGRGRQGKPLR